MVWDSTQDFMLFWKTWFVCRYTALVVPSQNWHIMAIIFRLLFIDSYSFELIESAYMCPTLYLFEP